MMNNTCFVLDQPVSEFSLTLYYTCNGGVDESTFSNDTSNNIIFSTHLSPGVSLIYDLAHDSGILQSELFTSRSHNLVSGKLFRFLEI